MLSYDDTVALGLPRISNRIYKGIPQHRLFFVPLGVTNHGANANYYVYMMAKKFKKGANRLLTVLYHFLRQIKWGGHPSKDAPMLVLMADNASENKNNDMFAFCCELVMCGWFREVLMMFGPVGHTHNGNDAVHYCHNQLAGNYVSVTLPEYIRQFERAWSNVQARPTALILDTQYDWRARYTDHINKVSNFSKKEDIVPIRAFKFSCDEGIVNMKFKVDPADKDWLGANRCPGSQGFIILKSTPGSPPKEIVVATGPVSEFAKLINNPALRGACEKEGKGSNLNWVLECALKSEVVSLGRVDFLMKKPESRTTIGTVIERVGARSDSMDLEIIRRTEFATTSQEFWLAPDTHMAPTVNQTTFGRPVHNKQKRQPSMRYTASQGTISSSDEETKDVQVAKPKKKQTGATGAAAAAVYPDDIRQARIRYGDPSDEDQED